MPNSVNSYNKLKFIQLQTKVFPDKQATFAYLEKIFAEIMQHKPDFVCLPEMFNCPYETKNFPLYAEEPQGITYQFCQNLAKKYKIYLSAGSIPEIVKTANNSKIYNTAYVFADDGSEIARHAKIHLFDVDVKGGQYFKESDTLSAGNQITVFDTKYSKMGICICYDLRFPELSRLMTDKGAQIILVPAAFNHTTGPLHWELLFRSRAADNQVFTLGTAPALNPDASYHSWGHSIAVSPWGKVLNQMDLNEGYISTEIDLSEVSAVREQLPLLKHRRTDIYKLTQINTDSTQNK